jgi:hypothetical protein
MILETITTLEIINSDASLNTTNFAGVSDKNSVGTNNDEVFSNDGLTLEVFKRAR